MSGPNSLKIVLVKAHTNKQSLYYDSNKKADDLCKLFFSLLKGLAHTSRKTDIQVASIPMTDIRMLIRSTSRLFKYTLENTQATLD